MIELRIRSRENGRMGRGCQRHMCVSASENNALLRHAIEVGSEPASRTEKTHAVGARGVERDDDYVGMENRPCSRKRQPRGEEQEKKQTATPNTHRKRESTIG